MVLGVLVGPPCNDFTQKNRMCFKHRSSMSLMETPAPSRFGPRHPAIRCACCGPRARSPGPASWPSPGGSRRCQGVEIDPNSKDLQRSPRNPGGWKHIMAYPKFTVGCSWMLGQDLFPIFCRQIHKCTCHPSIQWRIVQAHGILVLLRHGAGRGTGSIREVGQRPGTIGEFQAHLLQCVI